MRHTLLILTFFIIGCNSPQPISVGDSTNSNSTTNQPRQSKSADSLIISERIDGPANIRDTVKGKLLYVLNDNAPVVATEAQSNWVRVGILMTLTKAQKDELIIRKDSKIFLDGREVGYTVKDTRLKGALSTNEGDFGELVGYTSIKNIRPTTIPETVLSNIINSKPDTIYTDNLSDFLKDFKFQSFDGLLPNAKGFEIDENWIDDPSPLLRLWLIFKNEKLVGIFHSRPLSLTNKVSKPVDRGFIYTSFGGNPTDDSTLVSYFNGYIKQVD